MLKTYTTKSRIFQESRLRRQQQRRRRKKTRLYLFLIILVVAIVYLGNLSGQKIGEKINEIKYPVKYSTYITKYANENDLDPYLVIALIKQESNFIADARSEYAGGLMQLTEVTAGEYAKKLNLTD